MSTFHRSNICIRATILFAAIVTFAPAAFAVKPKRALKRVCVLTDGSISVRSKCPKGSSQLSFEAIVNSASSFQNLAGESGPKGATGALGAIGPVGALGAIGAVGPVGLQGPVGMKGPRGKIDFSACRTISITDSNLEDPNIFVLSTTLVCNAQSEFVLDSEFAVAVAPSSVGTKVFIQAQDQATSNGLDNNPLVNRVDYTATRYTSVGLGVIFLSSAVICCPR